MNRNHEDAVLPHLIRMYPESRSRMISFRLTDHEYERFRQLCSVRGHGSVSAMVRAAVNHLLGETDLTDIPSHPEIQTRVAILESHVATLAAALAEIDHRLSPTREQARQTAS